MGLPAVVEYDRENAFEGLGERELGRERNLNLILSEEKNGIRLRVQSRLSDFDIGEDWTAIIPITLERLHGAIQICRAKWRKYAIDYAHDGELLFRNRWDASEDNAVVQQLVIPQLAIAGRVLFDTLFFPSSEDTPATDFDLRHIERLNRIGRILEDLTARRSLIIRITSEDVYVPWNLLYSDPIRDRYSGEGAHVRGFWGYQHEIEHSLKAANSEIKLRLEAPVHVAAHLDEKIDKAVGCACNEDTVRLLAAFDDVKLLPRNTRPELADAFSTGPLNERIIYFCCHGVGIGDDTKLKFDEASLVLTDDEPITASDMRDWLEKRTLAGKPLVFLNACHSAQLNSAFYKGFAPLFLARQASAVVGTQTAVPAAFAGRFAQEFFCDFLLSKGCVGQILLDLRRRFIERYSNPLGFLYSLFHGADVHLDTPLTRREEIESCKNTN